MRSVVMACLMVVQLVGLRPGEAMPAAAAEPIAPVATAAPAGDYTLDRAHGSLIFRVNHLGFSNFTARFTRFDAALRFDPADPAAMTVTATVDPTSIETDYPDPQTLDFNGELQGAEWLDVVQFPEITFRSTTVEVTGPSTARVTGDLGLHGIARPVVLEVTFNGGYAGHPLDPNARIGFSARGALLRSDFGIAYGVPPPGSDFGVGDQVEVIIEAEFTGPPLAGAQPAQ